MNILVVTAHPLENSFCSAIASYTIKKLESLGHNVIIEDLYNNNFNPVLSQSERKSYYQNVYDQSGIQKEIHRLKSADAIVMIFPTWWFNFPAILKGWFDRVWVPTVAYDHATDYGPIKPKLTKLKKAFVVTTLGAPWWIDYFILWRPVKRIVQFALLGACAKNCKLHYLAFYKCENVAHDKINAFYSRIDKKITRYFTR